MNLIEIQDASQGLAISPPNTCPLCGAVTKAVYSGHPGYIRSQSYDIVHCAACDASHSWPLQVDSGLYNLIYANADKVPGYTKYHRLARQVAKARDPLSFLADASPIYWGIQEYFRSISTSEAFRVLDFGCGLGYLTYALSKAGVNCVGVDISREAIARAEARYGNLYACTDVLNDPAYAGQFQTVLCTELIEHIEQPKEFLAQIRHLLAPGGELVLTTPNKSAYPSDSVWSTDAPPVHLWWLSEMAIAGLAENCGYSECRFLDLSVSPKPEPPPSTLVDRTKPITTPVFDANGRLCSSSLGRLKSAAIDGLQATGVLPAMLQAYAGLRRRDVNRAGQTKRVSRYLCAILRNA